ncbi:MAG: hypothetical protein B6D55_06765 [Candidatus Omnitrophica bacterium 4484_70.2]|nr:MAG: hypothetical protein B6D55_06765 [Candidatus Omnitrophica bacterium 4484_70.2]
MFSFEDIDKARRILGLGEEASMLEIKERYFNLVKRHHPDTHSEAKGDERIKEINWAYKVLLDYCRRYRVSFKEKDVKRSNIDESMYEHLKRYYDGWWDNLDL